MHTANLLENVTGKRSQMSQSFDEEQFGKCILQQIDYSVEKLDGFI